MTAVNRSMDGENLGEQFQETTKHRRDTLRGRVLDWTRKPMTYKEYPGVKAFVLPTPASSTTTFDQAVRDRRSVRDFEPRPLSLEDLSYLLWVSTGIRERRGQHEFRTSPSAGALYPIETYLAINSVSGLEQGIYHYGIREHRLELLRLGDLGNEVAHGALDQEMCAQAPVDLMWTAVFVRSVWKYGQRAYRYIYLDAGHIAAQLSLAATALGLGSCQIAATYDDEINGILGIDGRKESILYMSVVGRPAERK
jgi:SagB-type dehydrogenase family enzyme